MGERPRKFSRWKVLGAVGSLGLAGTLVSSIYVASSWGAGEHDSAFLFRTTEELESLQFLLRDPETRRDLESFDGAAFLCRVMTTASSAPVDAGCDFPDGSTYVASFRHDFFFENEESASPRAFVLTYRSCRTASGNHQLKLETQGFQSDFSPPPEPVATTIESLRVFESAFRNPGILADIAALLEAHDVRDGRVATRGKDPITMHLFFELSLTIVHTKDTERTVLRYEAEYDPVSGETSFIRL